MSTVQREPDSSSDAVFKRKLVWWAVIGLCWIALGCLYICIPASPDQLNVDYVGWRVLSGETLYVDVIDTNWPAIFWLHAFSTWLFGHETYSWRVIDFAVLIAATLALKDLLRRQDELFAAPWSALIYPALYVSSGMWFAGQRDVLAANILIGVFWCDQVAWTSRKVSLQALGGVLLAFAVLIKPTSAIGGLLLVVPLLQRRDALRLACAHLLVVWISTIVMIATGLSIVFAQAGSARPFWESAVMTNHRAYWPKQTDVDRLISGFVDCLFRNWVWMTGLGLFAVVYRLRNYIRGQLRAPLPVSLPLFIGMWLGGIVVYVAQARGFDYHLGITFVATAVLCCIGLGDLSLIFRSTSNTARVAALLLLLVAVLGTGKKLFTRYWGAVQMAAGQISEEQWFAEFQGGEGLTAADVREFAQTIRSLTDEDETVLVWGSPSGINYLSRRKQPTRFYFPPTLLDAPNTFPLSERWNEQLREDICSSPPVVCFVAQTRTDSQFVHGRSSAAFVRRYLEEDYVVVGTRGRNRNVRIYVKRGSTAERLWPSD